MPLFGGPKSYHATVSNQSKYPLRVIAQEDMHAQLARCGILEKSSTTKQALKGISGGYAGFQAGINGELSRQKGQMLASCLDSQQRNDDSNQPLPPKRTKQITVAGNAVQSNAGVVVSIQAFVKLNKGDKIRTLINVEKAVKLYAGKRHTINNSDVKLAIEFYRTEQHQSNDVELSGLLGESSSQYDFNEWQRAMDALNINDSSREDSSDDDEEVDDEPTYLQATCDFFATVKRDMTHLEGDLIVPVIEQPLGLAGSGWILATNLRTGQTGNVHESNFTGWEGEDDENEDDEADECNFELAVANCKIKAESKSRDLSLKKGDVVMVPLEQPANYEGTGWVFDINPLTKEGGNVRIEYLDALEDEEEESEFDTFESEDDFYSRETIMSYDQRFQNLGPIRGKLSKDVTLSYFSPDATGIGKATLTKIWRLADEDRNGSLDRMEFRIMMHYVNVARYGAEIPKKLVPDDVFLALQRY